MESPVLSVIMTNFNHAYYLDERLTSILSQLDSNMEIVVVDDGSTDNSIEILERFSREDHRVKIIKFLSNKGVIAAANTALFAAKGLYIVSLAADDLILPGFIKKTLEVLLEKPELVICFSDSGYIMEGENIENFKSHRLIPQLNKTKIFQTPDDFVKFVRSHPFHIPGHTSIMKRDILTKHGGFKSSFEASCDWYLFHVVAFEGASAYIPETLSIMRLHKDSFSRMICEDIKRRNKSYLSMLNYLLKDENKGLYQAFKRSGVLDPYLAALKSIVLTHPKYWGFCASSAWLFFLRKSRKI